MVHLSELSWSRVQQPDEAVSVGDKLRAKLLSIQEGESGKAPRIGLSVKQAEGDPWQSVSERLAVDQIITGKVTRLAQFGAFVEILPGVEGLVHLSEMSWVKRVNKAEDVIAPGDTVSAKIKEIDPERRRISLSMKDSEGDPWADVDERFAVGSVVPGTVEKRAQFGLFVNLAPGITALLPAGLASNSGEAKQLSRLGQGDSVTLAVKAVDSANRRITLAPLDAAEDDGEWRKFAKPEAKKQESRERPPKAAEEAKPQLGTLGLALQAAALKKGVKK
jgi:small subunit ribosomal protein S1